MKSIKLTVGLILGLVFFASQTLVSQAEVDESIKSLNAVVIEVSPEMISVAPVDAQAEGAEPVSLAINQDTKLDAMASTEELKAGDAVLIQFTTNEGVNTAITIEKAAVQTPVGMDSARAVTEEVVGSNN